MTDEWLKWFLDQKPFRPFRFAMKNGDEHGIAKKEHVVSVGNGNILLGVDLGMGRKTISISDVVEIRQPFSASGLTRPRD